MQATFLGAYLTCDLAEIERWPISFRSVLEGHEYRHIVLAVRAAGKWGALGISRRDRYHLPYARCLISDCIYSELLRLFKS
jgi:Vasohibin